MRRPVPDSANTAASLTLVILSAVSGSAWSAEEVAAPSDWLTRDTLTGDWGGGRTWLEDRGVVLEPRLSQFYQGLSAGDGDDSHDYGGKATCAWRPTSPGSAPGTAFRWSSTPNTTSAPAPTGAAA